MRLEINMQEYVDVVKKLFSDNEINNILEIGSLNGNDALFFKTHFPKSNVYCIEGLPENYNLYLKNLSTITPINMVVADYDGEIVFHEKNINGIHSILNRGNEYGVKKQILKCQTMETICKEYRIDSLDMLKIDVEGASYQILKSMGNMFKTIKIMHIETESYPFFEGQILHSDVSQLLSENNFVMLDITSVKIGDGHQHDSVWINKKFYDEKRLVS